MGPPAPVLERRRADHHHGAHLYLALVLGELVPKRLALQNAERLALVAAPAVDRFAKLVTPFVRLLSRSTNLVVRILGGDPNVGREQVSDEEVRAWWPTTARR